MKIPLDKFVLRLPPGLRARTATMATKRYTSMNALMVEAVDDLVSGYKRLDLLIESVEALKRELEAKAAL